MLGGRKITAILTGETLEGLWPIAVHRGALYYPIAEKPGCTRNQRGLDGNGCYTMRYVLSTEAENSQIMSYSFFRRF